jgi:uncharacterized protein YndB with AHSA1/START domain
MPATITLSTLIPAPPDIVYSAWLDSDGHTAFTGATAYVDPRVGGRHSAWDGYIHGATLELLPGSKIVQSWRTATFPEGVDSRLEVHLSIAGGATRLTLVHSGIPEKHLKEIEKGWHEFYFKRMTDYFAAKAAARLAAKAAPPPVPLPPGKKPPKPPKEKKAAKPAAPRKVWGYPYTPKPPAPPAPAAAAPAPKAAAKPAAKAAPAKAAPAKAAPAKAAPAAKKAPAPKPAAKPAAKAHAKPAAKKPVAKAAAKPAVKKVAKPTAKKAPPAKGKSKR